MIPVLLSIPGCALDSSEDGVDEGRAGGGNTAGGDNDTSEVDSDDLPHQDYSWEAQQLPTIEVACEALADINWMLKPPQPKVEATKNVGYHCSSKHGWNGSQAFCTFT